MSAPVQWQQDPNGNLYYWENSNRCYVYRNGRRYYPDTGTWREPQPPSQSALQTPRVTPQATQSASANLASDRDALPHTNVSPTLSKQQYTTRQRQTSLSSGDSNDAGTRLQRVSSQQQASTGQISAGQAPWQATVATYPSGQGYGRTSAGDVSIPGASGSYGQAGLLSAAQASGHNVGHRQVGSASSARSTSTSHSTGASAAQGFSLQGTVKPIHREIEGTPGDFEKLDPRYQRKPHNFFVRFRVFKMHWAQPADRSDGTNVTGIREPLPRQYEQYLPKDVVRDKRFGQYIFTKIRWFIIVKEGADKCLCVPIITYQGKGVKKDVAKDEHAIVYTTKEAPSPSSDEKPKRGEKPMRTPIRVQPDEKGDKLLEMSRIDYGRVYTVEHNIKAMPFGMVHDHSRKDFQFDFLNVFMGDEGYKTWTNTRQQEAEEDDSDDTDDGDEAEDDP